jgi:hypothetical protein
LPAAHDGGGKGSRGAIVIMKPGIGTAGALGVLGAISGACAWGLIVALRQLGIQPVADGIGWVQLGPFTLAPGLVFGLAVGVYLAARGRLGGTGVIGYVLASCGSYLLAYHVAFVTLGMMRGDGLVATAVAGMAGGLCGSLALGFFTLVLLRADARAVRLSIVIGAAAGSLLPLLAWGLASGPGLGPLAFFAVWQAAYAASLAPVLATPPPV